jgi:hypothetical protein
MPYIHKYKYYNFLDFFQNHYFYTFKGLSYSLKDKNLVFKFSLYSVNKMKKMMTNGKGLGGNKIMRGRFRRK